MKRQTFSVKGHFKATFPEDGKVEYKGQCHEVLSRVKWARNREWQRKLQIRSIKQNKILQKFALLVPSVW